MRSFALAGGLVAAGLVSVVLAAGVRSAADALRAGDSAYEVSPAAARWDAHAPFGGVASRLAGIDDDLAARRALRLYKLAARGGGRPDGAARARAAQDALVQVANGAGPRAAQASTLLGILTFGQSASGTRPDQVQAAASDFAAAIRADPSGVAAKYDLELLVRGSATRGIRVGPGSGGSFGRTGRRGAGGGTPGRGY